MTTILAWTPFIEPIPTIGSWWPLLLLPLSIGLSLVFRAIRTKDLSNYARDVVIMSMQIILAMVGLGIVFGIVVPLRGPQRPVQRSCAHRHRDVRPWKQVAAYLGDVWLDHAHQISDLDPTQSSFSFSCHPSVYRDWPKTCDPQENI
jgi:hypothetical protein